MTNKKIRVITDIITEYDLKPGQSMKNMFGREIEESRVISSRAFVHTDRDFNVIRVVSNHAITGEEEVMTFTHEAFKQLREFNPEIAKVGSD